MTSHTPEVSAELHCHVCDYDLRAHPADGKCPECGASVAEARRMAVIPRRPAWRDSDPRWRRRMLAGVWVLVLMPLVEVLMVTGLASRIPMPTVFDYRGAVRTLDETLFTYSDVYELLVFSIGAVLLFSKERGRRANPLDWTRRWGIIGSYVVLFLGAVSVLFVGALVLAGIAALCLSMPLKYQPGWTQLFVDLSDTYLLYGPHPKDIAVVVLAAFSSITILLACVQLYGALRSTGPSWIAAALPAPLALFALMNLGKVGWYGLGLPGVTEIDIAVLGRYFWPSALVRDGLINVTLNVMGAGLPRNTFAIEAVKWGSVLAIAVWLTIAQFSAWRKRQTSESA